ncbi:MAG: DUF1501 domain-containing protein [Pirellulales bacterium]
MLRILSSPRRLCSGLTRRELLRVGGLGLAGLGLGDLLALQDRAAAEPHERPKSFGAAKSVILCHLYGAPSQLETFDPKPQAPVEIRGELGVIGSKLPGVQVGELLPKTAQTLDRCTILRSLTHPYPIHGVAYALTGIPTMDVAMELSPRDARHWPFFGSVVDYLTAQDAAAAKPGRTPVNMALPFPMSTRRVGEVPRAGPYAAFLGAQYDPIWTEFVGQGTRGIRKTLTTRVFDEPDPYMGTTPESHFALPSVSSLPGELTLDRLAQRRSLLDQLGAGRRELDASLAGRELNRYQTMAYDLLHSSKLAEALDVRREPVATRELYGHTLFGQSCLAARRLVEAGSRVVSVFWDEYGLAGSGWDTHWNHYQRMREELCPGFDQAWYGLINDLDRRGLLDETLVVCTSEHGRTPRLDNSPGGGRDHWSRVYSSILAGGGIARGRVVGASDRQAGDVADRPISPKDLLATMYHLLGINHHTLLHDRLGRPLPLVEGQVIHEALG